MISKVYNKNGNMVIDINGSFIRLPQHDHFVLKAVY